MEQAPVHFIPVLLSYVKFDRKGGAAPQVVEETRYMRFSNWSYAQMLSKLGVNKKDGPESIKAATEAMAADQETSIERSSVLIWASLIDEDPSLTLEDVMKMVDISQFKALTFKVVRAMAYYVHGPHAHDEADKAVAEAKSAVEQNEQALLEAAEEVEASEEPGKSLG